MSEPTANNDQMKDALARTMWELRELYRGLGGTDAELEEYFDDRLKQEYEERQKLLDTETKPKSKPKRKYTYKRIRGLTRRVPIDEAA